MPAGSPNLNSVERLWKLLRNGAFTRWHTTFEDREAMVPELLDHREG